jgi:nitrite reductase (cytochrome c-552)
MTEPDANRAGAAQPPAWRGWALLLAALAATFLLGLLAASIIERRGEVRGQPALQPIEPPLSDSANWRFNYPRQYDAYRRMRDATTRTRYGGSFPRDYLEETPANVILFAGHGFAKEYVQARGHVYSIEDLLATERVGPETPATCWTCKGPDAPLQMQAMGGLEQDGPARFYAANFHDFKEKITHPIGCYDCHDPESMMLRVERPALGEALARQDRDIDQATHQEMRSLVCAQCHSEYYFRGEGNYLVFPWDRGTSVEAMEDYFASYDFADWTHAVSKARMIKVQHPDYELYLTGIHAYRGVACADCHMPYRTEGGVKFTNHHIRSPLLDVANSCAVCHRWGEEEIRARVQSIQDKVRQGRDRAEAVLVKAHFDVAAAAQAGATHEQLAEVRRLVAAAQLRWDYVAAANGMGFHSPQESLRVLQAAVDLAGECRVLCAQLLARHGVASPVAYPDASTKQKAQALVRQFLDGAGPDLLGLPHEDAAAPPN